MHEFIQESIAVSYTIRKHEFEICSKTRGLEIQLDMSLLHYVSEISSLNIVIDHDFYGNDKGNEYSASVYIYHLSH